LGCKCFSGERIPRRGGYVTAPDLHRFVLALNSKKLVNDEILKKMWHNYSPEEGYGYGFFVSGKNKEKIIGHSGGSSGVSNNLDVHTQSGYITIVLSNYDQGAFLADEYIRDSLLALDK
jgi:CubicO group peptidase (beta-lactamase class C family)